MNQEFKLVLDCVVALVVSLRKIWDCGAPLWGGVFASSWPWALRSHWEVFRSRLYRLVLFCVLGRLSNWYVEEVKPWEFPRTSQRFRHLICVSVLDAMGFLEHVPAEKWHVTVITVYHRLFYKNKQLCASASLVTIIIESGTFPKEKRKRESEIGYP